MHASLNTLYKACYDRIGGVVFCGTPHMGSDAAAWGVLASNLVAMALMDSNTRLLEELRVDSEALGVIQEDFLKILYLSADNVRIHSFQEGRALSGVKGFDGKVQFGPNHCSRQFSEIILGRARLFIETGLAA